MRAPLAVLCCLLLSAPLRAGVLVVDAASGPGTDFTDLQAAADAAADGDVLLVRDGSYGGLLIDGKSLSVVADEGATVFVAFTGPGSLTEVINVPAAGSVLLRGLTLRSIPFMPTFIPGITCSLRNSAGTIWLDDCVIEHGAPSLLVESCARVLVTGSTVTGSKSVETSAGVALIVLTSDVVLAGTVVTGGEGRDVLPVFPAGLGISSPGGTGLELHGVSELTAAASPIRGGEGGAGGTDLVACNPPGAGGAGARLSSTFQGAPQLRIAGPKPVGGAAGTPVFCAPPAMAGQGQVVQAGTVLNLGVVPPQVSAATPTREGDDVVLGLQGAAGASAFLLLSAGAGGIFLPGKSGELLLDSPLIVLPLGPLPPGGALALSGAVPELGPGLEGVVAYVQVATCVPPHCTLGTGTALLLLDAAF